MKKIILFLAAFSIFSFQFSIVSAQTVKYQDFTLPSNTGKDVALSGVVAANKYTLLDFWASWCVPCLAEMPHLKVAYSEFHGRGFEIFAVSLDEDAMAWYGAIKRYSTPWPQASSLEGFGCPVAKLYGVRSIPRNYLIDSKGNIVAENLRGTALSAKLRELLK